MLDDELMKEMKKDIHKRFKEKKSVPVIYFSSHTTAGLTKLKDELWRLLNSQENGFEY
jgi:hypothetical protein